MKGPYAMAAAGALTAVVLGGVLGIGARGGSFGFGGEDEAAEHRPAVVSGVDASPAVDGSAPVVERRRGRDDDDDDDRREHRRGKERDHDDDDDDD